MTPQLSSNIQPLLDRLTATRDVTLPGGFIFSPNILQAVLVVALIFLTVVMFASFRRHYMSWSIKGILPGVSFGFALALIIEGILLISGRTILTETLGWKSAPKPISNALSVGREKLVDVLGVSAEIPSSKALDKPTSKLLMSYVDQMEESEIDQFRASLCE